MSRARNKSLITIYKDIMVTRRDLIDLRESITNTIKSIKKSDERIVMIEDERKKWQNGQQPQKVQIFKAPLPNQLKIRAKCEYCSLIFPINEALQQHKKEKHIVCKACKLQISQSLEDHQLFSCGETQVQCEGCSLLIKKRNLDAHVKICCFRECHRCKKDIYSKAYSFHLQSCKKTKHLIPECKQFRKAKHIENNLSLALPCCLVIDP